MTFSLKKIWINLKENWKLLQIKNLNIKSSLTYQKNGFGNWSVKTSQEKSKINNLDNSSKIKLNFYEFDIL